MKKTIMRTLALSLSLVLSIGFFSCTVAQDGRKFGETKYKNYLAGTRWKVNGVPFESKEQQLYSLSELGLNGFDDFNDRWGHFIYFDTLGFSSSYSAPCGNDCFTSVRGTYWFSAENSIRVKVNSIERSGFCDKNSEVIHQDYGYYDLVPTEYGYDLRKVE